MRWRFGRLEGMPFPRRFNFKCVCPKCGYSMIHIRRRPCRQEICPKCGTNMIREFSGYK